jgi:hypothetical membrane protein
MTRLTRVFARAQWAAGIGAGLGLASMVAYPGGAAFDHTSVGYSPAHNFLSDLGMTVAYDGHSNRLGAALFVMSLITLVVGLGGALVGFIRLYGQAPVARRLSYAAGALGVLVCAAFTGVAFTPENQVMALHVSFTNLAFRVFPGVTLLLTLAALFHGAFPKRVPIGWAVLTAVLAAFVVVIEWGPPFTTPDGLSAQVIAQKIVCITALLVIVYQSREADRWLASRVPVSSTI